MEKVKRGSWLALRELGSGGQGTVYKARHEPDPRIGPLRQITDAVSSVAQIASRGPDFLTERIGAKKSLLLDREQLRDLVDDYALADSSLKFGALKVLHPIQEEQQRQKAIARLAREIEALRQSDHPGLLRLLDANAPDTWLVTELHERGTLATHLGTYKGRLEMTLHSFRPLVEAVATLHARGVVHRDIKPANVFIASDDRLVLGDMGIVSFHDDAHTRVSDTYENVGSRDWMPTWAYGKRLDEVQPSFDVFGLGKVFWSMLSGRHLLQLWYHRRDENDVERMFLGQPEMRFARWILDESVVEEEKNCFADAAELLTRVDECLLAVSRHGQPARGARFCRVCGLGHYVQRAAEKDGTTQVNFGIRPVGTAGFRIFICDWCGHCDLFYFADKQVAPDWWGGGPRRTASSEDPVIPTPPPPAASEGEDLDEVEVNILLALARPDELDAFLVENLAHRLQVTQQKMLYHLERLEDRQLVSSIIRRGEPMRYRLARGGRELLVKRKLL